MGISLNETTTAGALMGTKTILNELLAYLCLSRLEPETLSPRSMLIITYAMFGCANPGSLGIMIRRKRNDIFALGFRSIVAGIFATCMTEDKDKNSIFNGSLRVAKFRGFV